MPQRDLFLIPIESCPKILSLSPIPTIGKYSCNISLIGTPCIYYKY